jgi:hypothetical protein
MKNTKSNSEIADEIANKIINGCCETIIHGQAVKMVFYSDVWCRVVSAVGTGTRKAQQRHWVSSMVDQRLKEAGVRQHS